jgi:hypothetical protein
MKICPLPAPANQEERIVRIETNLTVEILQGVGIDPNAMAAFKVIDWK